MKLIIDIPEDIYNHTQAYEIGGFNQENDARVFDLIKHGIPLDDVKAEILRGHIEADLMYVGRIIEILDNISKESEGKE